MTKQLLIIAAGFALAAAELHAQTSAGSAFQHPQPGWIADPSSGALIWVHMNRPDGQSGPVSGKPFSGIEVRHTTQTLANGTHVDHSDTSAFYRDDRGRMRMESPRRILIYDPVAGFTYNLDPETKTYQKWPIRAGVVATSIAVVGGSTWINNRSERSTSPIEAVRPAHGRLPFHAEPVTQWVTEDLPPPVINGIGVKGSRITMTIPTGAFGNDRDVKVINERWHSDELQVLVKSSNADPRFGLSTYELTNVVRSVPDPALFQVPRDYREKD